MKTNFRSSLLLTAAILTAVTIFAGCGGNAPVKNTSTAETANVAPTSVSVNSNNTNAANAGNIAVTTAEDNKTAEQMKSLPVTLPVLDALFADENFTGELKSKINLTDEQINNLREVSHQSVENLKQHGDSGKGSTTAAVAEAETKIRGIVGDDKTNQFFQMVQEKWSGGNAATTLSQQPNAVPTDTRVVVNTPAYRMDIFKDGKVYKSYKIGIGYPEFPLASGLRKAESIIFNPTWTPPDEPWVRGKVKAGQRIEAGSSMNPLGPIKIPIGSPSLIHGGKVPEKIGTFNSHGCVGLTNAEVQDFALNLAQASGTQLTLDQIQNYRKTKDKTQNLKLAQTMPVELRYETIVVENGVLHIYRDVYERKTNSLANLKAVLQVYGVSYDQLSDPERKQILSGLAEMNKDGKGQPIIKDIETADAASGIISGNKKKDKNQSGSVTRSIKGGKEVAVKLPQLSGKGYPAPVNLNSGK